MPDLTHLKHINHVDRLMHVDNVKRSKGMSSKSTQVGQPKSVFSGKITVIAIIIGIVFLTIIVIYPRIFSPSNIGRNSGPPPKITTPELH
jgi:hypothetical protein